MPARPRRYFVYLLSNRARTVLYIGVTNDLVREANPGLMDQSSTLALL